MIYSLIIIVGAVAFLVLLLITAGLRNRTARAGTLSVRDSEAAVCMPPLAVLERCFSVDDIEFTAGLRAPEVLRLLLSERRRLALRWIHRSRHEVRRVLRLHLRAARQSAGLRPAAEFSVLFYAVSFAFVSRMLVTVVYFYGPLRTRSFLRSTRSLANILSNLGGRIVVASPGTFGTASSLAK